MDHLVDIKEVAYVQQDGCYAYYHIHEYVFIVVLLLQTSIGVDLEHSDEYESDQVECDKKESRGVHHVNPPVLPDDEAHTQHVAYEDRNGDIDPVSCEVYCELPTVLSFQEVWFRLAQIRALEPKVYQVSFHYLVILLIKSKTKISQ